MHKPEFAHDSAEIIEARYQSRQMTRVEYDYWQRMKRQNDYLYKCPYVSGYNPDSFTSHLSSTYDYVRTIWFLEGTHYLDLYIYHGVSDGYIEYIDLAIADYGGSLYEKRLELAAELYHMGYGALFYVK